MNTLITLIKLLVPSEDIPKLYDEQGRTDLLVVGMQLEVYSVNRQTGEIKFKVIS